MAGDWQIKSIFHFTVNATNFERSLDFYTTIGFKVLRDNRDVIWPRMVARNFGMPAAQGRGALLGIGDGELHTRLDLIEWLEPALDPPPDTPIELRVPRIIALRTENVQAAYEDVSARGIEFVSQPQSSATVWTAVVIVWVAAFWIPTNQDLGVKKIKHMIRTHKRSHCHEARSYDQLITFLTLI